MVSTDPLSLVDSMCLYCYCRVNPIRFRDSDGRSAEDFSDLNDVVTDLNKGKLKVNLVDDSHIIISSR